MSDPRIPASQPLTPRRENFGAREVPRLDPALLDGPAISLDLLEDIADQGMRHAVIPADADPGAPPPGLLEEHHGLFDDILHRAAEVFNGIAHPGDTVRQALSPLTAPIKTTVVRNPPDVTPTAEPEALAQLAARVTPEQYAAIQASLDALRTQPLADGLDRQQLVAQVIQELADPSRIDQKSMNTCGATTAQILLARTHPEEYARLVAGLASPEGRVQLQDGSWLARDASWSFAGDGDRSLSSRLLQPAFMAAVEPGIPAEAPALIGQLLGPLGPLVGPLLSTLVGSYANAGHDGYVFHVPFVGDVTLPGMLPGNFARLMRSLTGQDYQAQGGDDQRWMAASPGQPVPVILNYAHAPYDGGGETGDFAPHWLQVTGYDAERHLVHLINPWGREEEVDEASFRAHLLSVVDPEPPLVAPTRDWSAYYANAAGASDTTLSAPRRGGRP
ncbi:MAG: hypothetical protein JWM80_2599 [Cyanobacteria bacterium RYN_339]|nr:hypothetical protein [Cyanobacteria bacterium RYN_339]